MKNVSHNKSWDLGMIQVHVEPPSAPLIKLKYDVKPDKYFVKLKLRRDPKSLASDLYGFKMSLFVNGESEEFFVVRE